MNSATGPQLPIGNEAPHSNSSMTSSVPLDATTASGGGGVNNEMDAGTRSAAGRGVTTSTTDISDELFLDDELYEICYDEDDDKDDDMFFGDDMDFLDNPDDDHSQQSRQATITGDSKNNDNLSNSVLGTTTTTLDSTTSTTTNNGVASSTSIGDMQSSTTNDTGGGSSVNAFHRRTLERMKQPKIMPRQPWHNETTDKQHRQAMILEIARLLQARKKAVPSNGWLQQLPHKARKLEGRLYLTAPSLEKYCDRTTLKVRLKKLATVIMVQFKNTKKARLPSSLKEKALSSLSMTMKPSTTNNSQPHDIATENATNSQVQVSAGSSTLLTNTTQPVAKLSSIPTNIDIPNRSHSITSHDSQRRSSSNEVATRDDGNGVGNGGYDSRRQSVSSHGSAIPGDTRQNLLVPANSHHGSAMLQPLVDAQGHSNLYGQQQQQNGGQTMRRSSEAVSSDALSLNTPLSGALQTGGSQTVMGNNHGDSVQQYSQPTASASSLSELERQKAVNARLQEQIRENILRQEVLVQRLQANEVPHQMGQQQQQSPLLNSYNVDTLNPHDAQLLSMHRNSLGSVSSNTSLPSTSGLSPLAINSNLSISLGQNQLGNNMMNQMPSDLSALFMGAGNTGQLSAQMLQSVLQNSNNPMAYGNMNYPHMNPQQQFGDSQLPMVPNFNNSMIGGGGGSVSLMANTSFGLQQQQQQQLQLQQQLLQQQGMSQMSYNTNASVAGGMGTGNWNVDAMQSQQSDARESHLAPPTAPTQGR